MQSEIPNLAELLADRPEGVSGKAPLGFSAVRARRELLADYAVPGKEGGVKKKKKKKSKRDAGDQQEMAQTLYNVPFELQPLSFDTIEIKDIKGLDGPWFAYGQLMERK
eukprot:NODE_23686_length_655_cov_4.912879.p1 GENE.NODE_23686_length_655_cov_4.912879~~NODE_23686_length_655_cov_4.912879.p1  ORF type:complete len:109 (-),score=35.61 NODE_23686_length_655_cov_4.912879:194-520(-)